MIIVIFQKCSKSLVNKKSVHFFVHPLQYVSRAHPSHRPLPAAGQKGRKRKGWVIRGKLLSKEIFEKYCDELNRKAYNLLVMLKPLEKSVLFNKVHGPGQVPGTTKGYK